MASILMENYEITVDDSKPKKKKKTMADPHDGVPSGVKGPSAIAQYADGTHEKPSSPPKRDLKQNPASSVENAGSSSCELSNSTPSFPVDATTLPALALALPGLTIDEPSRDPQSSSTLQERSTIHDTKPGTAPQGTSQWKRDLSEHKGHQIHLLHVGDAELDIPTKCLSYLYNATSKADECFDFIIEKREPADKTSTKRLEYNDDDFTNERRRRRSAKAPLSGSRYVPYTIDLDTAVGYRPLNNADAYASGYHQLQIAAQSSFPSPIVQPQPRRRSSIIDLETYDLNSESNSRSATPTPTHQSSSPSASSLFSLKSISISSPGDFGMASPSSSEVEGSEDSDRTLRDVVSAIYEGEAVRNRFGSPVPFAIHYDDDDGMDEGDDDAGSADSYQTVRAGDGGLGGGAYATVESDLGGNDYDRHRRRHRRTK